MDIALSTLLLIYLLLPGLAFRRYYYTEEFSKEYFKESISTLLISIILPATALHLFAWIPLQFFFDVDTDVLAALFSGSDSIPDLKSAFANINEHINQVVAYVVLTCIMGAFAGNFSKNLVRKKRWDRRFKMLRFQNEWHYLFTGEILEFPRINKEPKRVDLTYVDLLVDTSLGPVIYMGILEDYLLSKAGGIDRIYLSNVNRRLLKEDGVHQYYNLSGEFFVVPFEKVLNIHLTYYSVDLIGRNS